MFSPLLKRPLQPESSICQLPLGITCLWGIRGKCKRQFRKTKVCLVKFYISEWKALSFVVFQNEKKFGHQPGKLEKYVRGPPLGALSRTGVLVPPPEGHFRLLERTATFCTLHRPVPSTVDCAGLKHDAGLCVIDSARHIGNTQSLNL